MRVCVAFMSLLQAITFKLFLVLRRVTAYRPNFKVCSSSCNVHKRRTLQSRVVVADWDSKSLSSRYFSTGLPRRSLSWRLR